jgi:hypothetical protein
MNLAQISGKKPGIGAAGGTSIITFWMNAAMAVNYLILFNLLLIIIFL